MNKIKKRHVPPGTYFWILIAVIFLALIVGFINALFYKGDTGQMLGRDATKQLDSVLRSNRISHVIIGEVPIKETRLEGKQAQRVIDALKETNRVKHSSGGRMAQTGWITLQDGTNNLQSLLIHDGGIFVYNEYTFTLKTPMDFSEPEDSD